jgi:hypothetical protein
MRKVTLCLVGVALLLATAAAAQDRLSVTATAPRVDGIISPQEYSLQIDVRRGTLHLNRTEALLSVALRMELDGWVAVGFGSQRMDKAAIYIGYVDSGQEVFAKQIGRGHGHSDADVPEPQAARLSENDGATILELSFPASAFIASGAGTLSLIVAGGSGDNLRVYHAAKEGLEIEL